VANVLNTQHTFFHSHFLVLVAFDQFVCIIHYSYCLSCVFTVLQSFRWQIHNVHSLYTQLTFSSFIFPCINSSSFHLYIASRIVLVEYMLTSLSIDSFIAHYQLLPFCMHTIMNSYFILTHDKRWLLDKFMYKYWCLHIFTNTFDSISGILTFHIGCTSLVYTSHLFYLNENRQCVSKKRRNTIAVIYKPLLLSPTFKLCVDCSDQTLFHNDLDGDLYQLMNM
jgi:hypothetical protein